MNVMIVMAALFAATTTATTPAAEPPDGGMLRLNGKGRIVLVNACEAPAASLEQAAKRIGGMMMLDVRCQPGAWSLTTAAAEMAAKEANVAVFVVRDDALPMSLVAMESKWGVVNAKDLDAAGLQKEIVRVATVVLGGAVSKYPASSMRPVYAPEDLAKAGDLITIDSLMAIFPNLETLGLKQYDMMTYRDACEEGIAPQPTNDVQKAIWDEVHKLPTAPILIKPNAKK